MRLLFAAAFLTLTMWAQSADVSGIVRDSSGAAVPHASVTLLHLETGTRRLASSGTHGSYAISGARPGAYRVSVRRSGFQPAARQGIRLSPGDHARIDFTLAIQTGSETVAVHSDNDSRLRTESAVAVTINRAQIETTPLNGRTLLPFLEAQPGAVITPSGGGEAGQFSVNGQRQNANYVTVDGVSANFAVHDGLPGQSPSGSTPVLTALGSMHSIAPVEALEEVRTETGASASTGRLPGAHVAIQTRSGGNAFHGSAFEYTRHDALDANNWFANSRGAGKSPLRVNDFGAALGGPIRKDRTFFFAAHESLRMNLPYTLRSAVPNDAFREIASPRVRELVNAYPRANGASLGGWFGELTMPVSRLSGLQSSSLRVDHSFGSSARLFARAYQAPSYSTGGGQSAFTMGDLRMKTQGVTVGFTNAVSPNGISDFRAGWAVADAAFGVRPIGGATANLGLLVPSPGGAAETSYSVYVDGLEPVIQASGNRYRQPQWNIAETFTLSLRRHEWKFGADSRTILPAASAKPWNIFAAFGSLDSVSAGQIALVTTTHQLPVAAKAHNFSLFAQDQWKLHPRMQVTYGMRWEWNPPMMGRSGTLFTPVVGLTDSWQAALAEPGTPLWNPGRGSFAPRAGVALRAWRSLVLRGGAAVFYDPGYGVLMSSIANAPPFSVSRSELGVSLNSPSPLLLEPAAFLPRRPYERALGYQPGFRLPRVTQWHAGVEMPVRNAAVATATFIAANGNGLMRREWLSRPNPEFRGVEVMTNGAFSRYRALQTQLRSRTGGSFQYLLSYTLSTSIDNASRDSELYAYGDAVARARDIGASSFDIHRAWYAMGSWEPKRAQLKGWGLDMVMRSRTAFPLNVLSGVDPVQLNSVSYVLRPDLVPGEPAWLSDPNAPGGRVLNRAAFSTPSGGLQGSLGRNSLRGFGFSQVDLSLRRTFRLRGASEGRTIELRADAFNAFNRANLGDPQSLLRSPQFGESLSTLNQALGSGGPANGLMPVFQIGGPRSIQLSVRFRF